MNGENVEKVYRQCHKRERDRDRQWRKSKRKGNIRNVVHLVDFEAAEAAENSPSWLSDNGAGVEAIISACDGDGDGGEAQEEEEETMPEWARKKIARNLPKIALDVARLVVRHKDDEEARELNLCEIEQWIRDASGKRPGRSTGAT